MWRSSMLVAALLAFSTLAASAADSALSPAANSAYLAAYAKKPGVVVRPSGLEYRILQSGFGARPGATNIVSVAAVRNYLYLASPVLESDKPDVRRRIKFHFRKWWNWHARMERGGPPIRSGLGAFQCFIL